MDERFGLREEEGAYGRRFVLLVLIVVVVTVGRSFFAIVWPTLCAEDGRDLFAWYRNHPGGEQILRFYAGYVALAPNLAGYLSARVPAPAAPYVLTGFALLLTVAARCVFYLRRFRFLLPSDRQRLLVCLLLTLAPVGSFRLLTLASFSIWHLLFLLLLLAGAPPARSVRVRLAELPVLALAAVSRPRRSSPRSTGTRGSLTGSTARARGCTGSRSNRGPPTADSREGARCPPG